MNRRMLFYRLARARSTLPQILNMGISAASVLWWKFFKKGFVGSTPLILMVEPTDVCNFKCPLCDKGSGRLNRDSGYLKPAYFVKILDSAGSGLKMLYLWNQGEPFLNKELPAMIAAAKIRHIFCIVSTNGSLLERDAEAIAACGLDELIVSLDGADAETFNLYRRGGDFGKIVAGTKKLVQVRGKKSRPLISLQFLLLKHNYRQIEQFRRLQSETGADRILWKTAQVYSSAEAAEFLPADSSLSRYADAASLTLKRKRFDCRRILYSAVIDWNGNLVPCCFDKDENITLGNVLNDDLKSIWKSEKYREFRQKIAAGERPPMCANCTEGLERLFIS